MANGGREQTDESAITRVSDAMVEKQGELTLRNWLRKTELWLLIDASRWWIIAGLAAGVYVVTMLVGVFGPASIQQYLLDGTAIADAYIELQPGIITAITIVLGINQLVLSPEFGPISHQRQRLDDILSHRRDVEETADVTSSPTDPSGFLRTITDAIREHLLELEDVISDSDDRELHNQVTDCITGIRGDIGPVSDTLDEQRFGHIELFGTAIHFDTTRHIHRIRRLRRIYEQELSETQSQALEGLLTDIEHYSVAREYFRTQYFQTQFIRFSRTMLFAGLPALVVAHYAVGIIGPGVLTGTTFGIRNLLWFENGTFTVAVLPVLIIVSYVARIVTIAETSIFLGPFSAEKSVE